MILKILRNVLLGSSRGKLERDIKPLRPFIKLDELIPWGSEEIGLLSLQLEHKTKKTFFNTVVSGALKTIYAESVIGYAYKDVYTGTKKGIILAKSMDNEYVYKLTQGVAQVYINGDAIGVIDYHGRLIANRSRKVLAMIEQSTGIIQEISVDGVKIGSLNKPVKNAALHQRAVQLFKETSNKGRQFLVSLVIFEILKRNV